jgi:multidrug efflux pump subunit AcrA (membrane-fusion protein)
MNSSRRKILLIALAIVIILIGLIMAYMLQKKAVTPPAHPPIDEQLKNIGQLQPLEPTEIFATTGQIKRISNDR